MKFNKKFFLYFLGLCFMCVAWYYQYLNSMEYQRFVAVRIGSQLVEMKSVLEQNMVAGEKLRTSFQRGLQGLGIEIYGDHLEFLSGYKKPKESLPLLAQLNQSITSVVQRDKIADYYSYGKKWAAVKILLGPTCSAERPEDEKVAPVKAALKNLMDVGKRIANRNDLALEALKSALDSGEDYEKACKTFLEKVPMHTLARIVHGMDQVPQ